MKLFFIYLTLLISSLASGAETSITLNEDNHVLLRNEINDITITKLEEQLTSKVILRGTKNYTIYLVLDSPGGSISSGLDFIEFAKTIPNLETITLFSASMASGIVEALPGKRNILESGILMFHRAAGSVAGQFESGELESRLMFYKRLVRAMEVKNADRMGMSLEKYKAAVKDEFWILGSEAVALKAADTQVAIVCTKELITQKSTEAFNVLGLFTVKVQFSKCPLLRGGTVEQENQRNAYMKYRAEKWSIN